MEETEYTIKVMRTTITGSTGKKPQVFYKVGLELCTTKAELWAAIKADLERQEEENAPG